MRPIIIYIIVIIAAAGVLYYYTTTPRLMPAALKPTLSPLPGSRVLFIGSSSTAGDGSYADQFSALYPDVYTKKIAQVGAQTSWMIENASEEISSGSYDVVVIFGGLNDIYATGSTANAKENLQYLIDLATEAGAFTVLITVQPTDFYASYTDLMGSLTLDLNNWIIQSDSMYTIDLYTMLLTPEGSQNTALFQPDNLHLSYTAHAMLADALSNEIISH